MGRAGLQPRRKSRPNIYNKLSCGRRYGGAESPALQFLHLTVLVDGISGPEGRQRIARGVSRGTWSWVNRLPAPEGRQTMAHTFADLLTHFQEFIALLKAHGFASAERHIWE